MSDRIDTVQPAAPKDKRYVSRRGRRLVLGIIIILLLSLAGVSVLLLNYVSPKTGVAKKDEAGGIEWVRSIYGWGMTPDQQFNAPRKVNLEPNGNILVADPTHRNITVFTPSGRFVREYKSEVATDVPLGLAAVSVGPEGAVYAAEPDMDRVHVFTAAGKTIGKFSIPDPQDIAYKNGTMVIGSKAGFAIVDPNNGKPKLLIGSVGKGDNQFDTVTGVAIGDNGTIYALDAYNNRLSAYKQSGKRLWIVRTGGATNKTDITNAGNQAKSLESSAPAQLALPSDITIDGKGRLVVVDGLDMSVSFFDPNNGKFLGKYGMSGEKDGQLLYPSSIVYDPARDWFVLADTGNHRVLIFRIPGTSNSAGPLASVRRTMSGPLRVCAVPLVLLLLIAVGFVVTRRRRRKGEQTPPATEMPDVA